MKTHQVMARKNCLRANQWTFPDVLRRCIAAWITGSAVVYISLPAELRNLADINAVESASGWGLGLVSGGVFIVLSALTRVGNTNFLERWWIVAAFVCMGATGLFSSFAWPFLLAVILITGFLIYYACNGWQSSDSKPRVRSDGLLIYRWLTVGVAVLAFLILSIWTVSRVLSFHTPTYDFGIFSQMFHSMKTTGLPITTLEREVTLSHFRVHFSPIYYLLLPLYQIFPKPAALQVFQAAVMVSSAVPMWLLGRQHGLTSFQRMLVCIVLLLLPAFFGGAGYDIHENCFLTPLLLWLFLGIDRKNTGIVIVSGVLILLVKEDAAVYVATVGLWLLVSTCLRERKQWDILAGSLLLVGAIVWFIVVCHFLETSGDGVMTYRYSNFIYGERNSLLTVILAILRNPMKLFYECVDAEKLPYIGLTLLPLLGFPLWTRRYERYILLIPYILMNLMSDYSYQHNIYFQYSFGSTACLIYLTAVNLSDLRYKWHKTAALLGAAAVCAGCFGALILPTAIRYPVDYIRNSDSYSLQREVLDNIPSHAPVSADTFYTTWLSQRATVFDIQYASREQILITEYVVVDCETVGEFDSFATDDADGYSNFTRFLQENGYIQIQDIPGVLTIYYREAA